MKKVIIVSTLLLALATIASAVSAVTVLKSQPGYLWQWTSSSPSRVMVDSNTGYITPIWYGSADICAQLKSDLSIKFCTTVTVQ